MPDPDELTALRSALIERSPDVVVVLDQGIIRYVSPAVTEVTGWTAEQVVGRHIVELIHPDDVERAAFDLDLYTKAGAVPGYSNYRVALADGSWRWFEAGSADFVFGTTQLMALYCRVDERAGASRRASAPTMLSLDSAATSSRCVAPP